MDKLDLQPVALGKMSYTMLGHLVQLGHICSTCYSEHVLDPKATCPISSWEILANMLHMNILYCTCYFSIRELPASTAGVWLNMETNDNIIRKYLCKLTYTFSKIDSLLPTEFSPYAWAINRSLDHIFKETKTTT
jgi:hypothetical protein